MPLYQLKSGIANSKIVKFDSHDKAWNTLRIDMPDKHAVLFMQTEIQVPMIQKEKFIKAYRKKYGVNTNEGFVSTKDDPAKTLYWIPVAKGITNHAYNL